MSDHENEDCHSEEQSVRDRGLSRRRFLRIGMGAVVATGAALGARRALLSLDTQHDFWVHDFGALGDGRSDDGPAIRSALDEAATRSDARVLFRPGTYRLGEPPEGSYALKVARARNLTIEGQSATLLVGEPRLGCLRFDQCQNTKARGLTIDYDPLPHALGVVRDVRPTEDLLDVEFDHLLPMPDASFFTFARPADRHPTSFGVLFDAETRGFKRSQPDHLMVEMAKRLTGDVFRLKARRRALSPELAVGDFLVYPVRQFGNALSFFDSPGAVIEDVRIHAANAAAIGLIRSEGARILSTTIAPGFGSHRLFSTNGDGVHAQDCRVGPVIEQCRFEGMLDDGLNAYGQPLVITDVAGDIEFTLAGRGDVRTGDVIQFFDPFEGRDRGIRGVVRAQTIEKNGRWHVRVDRPVHGVRPGLSHQSADTVFNLSACGSGVSVRKTLYQRHRGISVRIRSHGGSVENNVFSRSGSAAVALTNTPDWPEGPAPTQIVLAGNHIDRPNAIRGMAAIDIGARALANAPADGLMVHDVTVENNVVEEWRGAAVFLAGARQIVVRDTRLQAPGQSGLATSGVRVEKATAVAVERLRLSGSVPVAVSISPSARSVGDDAIRIGDVQADATTVKVREER